MPITADVASEYDYVIAGGGSSGCIIAAQLAATGRSVLLVEAGGTDVIPAVPDPRMAFSLAATDLVNHYACLPSPALNGRSVPVGEGRILGGGGSVNPMIWMRGFASDFDAWADAGCTGWGFNDVLPAFKDLEDWEGGDNAYRATGGPIHVRQPSAAHPITDAWIAAAAGLGLERFDDVNAPMRAGVGYPNLNIGRDGRRCSSARAYLHPVLSRPNLTVALNTRVAYLTIDGGRCTGCHIVGPAGYRTVRTRQEMIVTSGGIGSPHLLLRSGVGDAGMLRAAGVAVRLDRPQVGRNYQDHPMVRGLVLRSRERLPEPHSASNHAEVCSLFHSGEGDGVAPDLLAVAIDQPAVNPETEVRYGPAPVRGHGFTLALGLMRPSSRGTVRLAGADWRSPPIIDNGLLKTDLDLRVAVKGIEYLREMSVQPAIEKISAGEVLPGRAVVTVKDFADLARNLTHTFYHPAGACRMGSDDAAVVDPQLRVNGIDGLRVCDSSVMPVSVSCPTNAASCMIGLRASELILASR